MRRMICAGALALTAAVAASDWGAPGASADPRVYEFVAVTQGTLWQEWFEAGRRVELVHFSSAHPSVITHRATIDGEGEGKKAIWALAVRQSTHELYAVGESWRLLKIDEWTGAVTWAGPVLEVPLGLPPDWRTAPRTGWNYPYSLQMDFDPRTDELRVAASSRRLMFRVNPDTGRVIDGDPATDGVEPDAEVVPFVGGSYWQDDGMKGLAYDPSAAGTPAYTFEGGQLVRIDGLGRGTGTAPRARLVSPEYWFNFSTVGMDVIEIAPDGAAFVMLEGDQVWKSHFARMNLATGKWSPTSGDPAWHWEDICDGVELSAFCVSPSMQFESMPQPPDLPAAPPVEVSDPPRIDHLVILEDLGSPGADVVTIRGIVDVGGDALESTPVTVSAGDASHDFTLDGARVGRDGRAVVRFGRPHGDLARFRVKLSPEDLAHAVEAANGDDDAPLSVVVTVAGVEHRADVRLKVAQRGRRHRIAHGRTL